MPEVPPLRPMRQEDIDSYIYQNAPAGIREWVQACAAELGRQPKRLDVVKAKLSLPEPHPDAYPAIGVYRPKFLPTEPGEHAPCFDLDIEVPLPTAWDSDVRRPSEPRTEGLIGAELAKLWEVCVAREDREESEFPDLPRSEVQLARWKYRDATVAVHGCEEARLPLDPAWQHFAKLCRNDSVGAEGLDLAVLLDQGPWTFDVSLVAPSWVDQQISWDDSSGFAHDRSEAIQRSYLFLYSRILKDLRHFLNDVDFEEQQRTAQKHKEARERGTQVPASTPKVPELSVPRKRLEKAKMLLEKCERPESVDLDPWEKHNRLVHNLAQACPAWVAYVDEKPNPGTEKKKDGTLQGRE